MRNGRARWVAVFLGAAGLSVLPASVAAQQDARVVVLGFQGRGAAAARAKVVSALQGAVQLVPRDRAESAARAAGVSLREPVGRAMVAEQVGIDLFVTGRVRGRGRRARLALAIHSGRDGSELVSERLRVRGRGFSARVLQLVQEAASRLGPPAPVQEPEPEPAADPFEPPPDPGDEGEAGEAPVRRFVLLGGLGLRSRSAEVVTTGGAFRRYEGGLFGQLGLRAWALPLAGDEEDPLRGLRFEIGLDLAVGLKSTDPASGEELSTSAVQWWVEAGYRHDLDVGLHLGGGLAFVSDAFTIAQNAVLPSASYPALRVGLDVGYVVLPGKLDLEGRFGYRVTFGVGELADAFGADAGASGWDLGLRASGSLPSGIAYGLEVGYRKTAIDFSGDAADTQGRSGSDGSFSVQLLGGYAF